MSTSKLLPPVDLADWEVTVRRGDLTVSDLRKLQSADLLAMDIETSGLSPLADSIGTVQIADDEERAWLLQIEPGVRPDLLCALVERGHPAKVFHHAPFDLRFMSAAWGVLPQNVACTKVLHRLVSPDGSHSLKDVLSEVLGVHLRKDETVRKSNWSAADLSSRQIDYALLDTAYLIPLYTELMERATQAGVSRFAERAFDYLPTKAYLDLRGITDVFAY